MLTALCNRMRPTRSATASHSLWSSRLSMPRTSLVPWMRSSACHTTATTPYPMWSAARRRMSCAGLWTRSTSHTGSAACTGRPPSSPTLCACCCHVGHVRCCCWVVITCAEHGFESQNCLFIGDATTDYDAAAETGLRFLGVVNHGEASPFAPNTTTCDNVLEGLERISAQYGMAV